MDRQQMLIMMYMARARDGRCCRSGPCGQIHRHLAWRPHLAGARTCCCRPEVANHLSTAADRNGWRCCA
jgi:hypothetical protein